MGFMHDAAAYLNVFSRIQIFYMQPGTEGSWRLEKLLRLRVTPVIPYCSSLLISDTCGTFSKASEKYKKIESSIKPESFIHVKLFMKKRKLMIIDSSIYDSCGSVEFTLFFIRIARTRFFDIGVKNVAADACGTYKPTTSCFKGIPVIREMFAVLHGCTRVTLLINCFKSV